MSIKEELFFFYQKCPKKVRDFLFQLRYHRYRQEVLSEWRSKKPEDVDLAKAVAYLHMEDRWTWLPGIYEKKYDTVHIKVDRSDDGFPFVLVGEKRLYFPKHFSKSWTEECYVSLLREQDTDSPHGYFSDMFPPPYGNDEILLDIGAAEGLISLKYIDQVKRAIIFECDENWIKALQKTFLPYKEKVTIVQGYVSGNSGGNCIQLDDYIANCISVNGFNDKYIIKMDIEGSEADAISGSMKLLQSKNSRFAVCTYHKPAYAEKFDQLFKNMGYNTCFTPNYMLFGGGIFGKPSFRKGVIQAWPQ